MNWYSLFPTNKYTWIGFVLMFLGILTLPIFIGFFIMPIGLIIMVFGVHKSFYDIGKTGYNLYKKVKDLLVKISKYGKQ